MSVGVHIIMHQGLTHYLNGSDWLFISITARKNMYKSVLDAGEELHVLDRGASSECFGVNVLCLYTKEWQVSANNETNMSKE